MDENSRCRLCLQTSGRSVSIFSSDIPSIIEELTSIKVTTNDGLPTTSCETCISDLRTAITIRKRILQSDRMLRNEIPSALAETIVKKERSGEIDDEDEDSISDMLNVKDFDYVDSDREYEDEDDDLSDVEDEAIEALFRNAREDLEQDGIENEASEQSANEPSNKDYNLSDDEPLIKKIKIEKDPIAEKVKPNKERKVSRRNSTKKKEAEDKPTETIIIKTETADDNDADNDNVGAGDGMDQGDDDFGSDDNSVGSDLPGASFKLPSNATAEKDKDYEIVTLAEDILEKTDNPPSVRCKICDITLVKERAYLHKNKHMKAKCKICGIIIRSDNVKKHILGHKYGPQVCDICGSFHKSIEGLRSHLFNFHTKRKNYKCDQCDQEFRMNSKLWDHKRRVHTDDQRLQIFTSGLTEESNPCEDSELEYYNARSPSVGSEYVPDTGDISSSSDEEGQPFSNNDNSVITEGENVRAGEYVVGDPSERILISQVFGGINSTENSVNEKQILIFQEESREDSEFRLKYNTRSPPVLSSASKYLPDTVDHSSSNNEEEQPLNNNDNNAVIECENVCEGEYFLGDSGQRILISQVFGGITEDSVKEEHILISQEDSCEDSEFKLEYHNVRSESVLSSGSEYVPDTADKSSSSDEEEQLYGDNGNNGITEVKNLCGGKYLVGDPGEHILISQVFGEMESTKNAVQKRVPDFCYICECEVLNFARHIMRNHSYEPEVQKIISLQVNTKERKSLISILRKKGNFIRNSQEWVKPARRSNLNLSQDEYAVCKYCLGFFRRKHLWRHVKTCELNDGLKTSYCHLSDSQNMLLPNLATVDKKLREEVFPRMAPDSISLTAKRDSLICSFGARYIHRHKEKHFINVCSRKMREVAKLLIEMKKLEPQIRSLSDALRPKYFDLLVKSTKAVARYDPEKDVYESPTYAMNIHIALKQCCDIALLSALKQPDGNPPNANKDIKTLKRLFNDSWKFQISSKAAADLNTKKPNKLTLITLTTDIKIFREYLLKRANQAVHDLEENEQDEKAYKILLETVFCHLLILNRKGIGELQKMMLEFYHKPVDRSEFEAVTQTENILLNKFKSVVISGEGASYVPVLFSPDLQKHTDQLLRLRKNFIPSGNTYLFAYPETIRCITGYKVLQKHIRISRVKNPCALASPRLRRHLATISQLLSMSSDDVEQLVTLMGHKSDVHKNDIFHTAKISKVLLLMQRGEAAQYKGKSLDEIDLDMEKEIVIENDQEEILPPEENDVGFPAGRLTDTEIPLKRKSRVLVPWTDEQKSCVKDFFKCNIINKKPPKKMDCEELKEKYPNTFTNKTWQQIKVYIQNCYTK